MSNGKFIIGETYTTRSACDYDCIFSITVISRTEKTVTVKTMNGVKRCKVTVYDGVETCAALGRYSMSPTFRAEKAAPVVDRAYTVEQCPGDQEAYDAFIERQKPSTIVH